MATNRPLASIACLISCVLSMGRQKAGVLILSAAGAFGKGWPWTLPLQGRQNGCGVVRCLSPDTEQPPTLPLGSVLWSVPRHQLCSQLPGTFGHRCYCSFPQTHAHCRCLCWLDCWDQFRGLVTQDVRFAACSTLAQISSHGIKQNTFYLPNYMGEDVASSDCPESSLTLGEELLYLRWLVPLWLVPHRGAVTYVPGHCAALHGETVTEEDRE